MCLRTEPFSATCYYCNVATGFESFKAAFSNDI